MLTDLNFLINRLLFFKQISPAYPTCNQFFQIFDFYPLLFHAITMTDGNSIIFQCLVIYGDTERSTYRILSAVTFSY
jgi:hypothetical protein